MYIPSLLLSSRKCGRGAHLLGRVLFSYFIIVLPPAVTGYHSQAGRIKAILSYSLR